MEREKELRTQGRDKTNTKACEESARNEQGLPRSSSLQDNTKVENKACRDHQSKSTAEQIAERRSEECSEKRSGRQDGNDEGIL